jgi:hypothetical protein
VSAQRGFLIEFIPDLMKPLMNDMRIVSSLGNCPLKLQQADAPAAQQAKELPIVCSVCA